MNTNRIQIIDAHDYAGGIDTAISYIHGKWGSERNLNFYRDAIIHYGEKLPRFFLLCDNSTIIGCGALLISDFASRHDLWPWYACHYIEAEYRGKALGTRLLDHGIKLAAKAGFSSVYLSTDHDGYYEKYGWERIDDAFEPTGAITRIYKYSILVP
ncbi:MAG: GNAT family N-acetyltransferase [Candidatus Cloacimonadaceae bacterium]|nr:GNAT family N-acetyltransferase [Candidatus Cloacimonadaceae bacterium]